MVAKDTSPSTPSPIADCTAELDVQFYAEELGVLDVQEAVTQGDGAAKSLHYSICESSATARVRKSWRLGSPRPEPSASRSVLTPRW